MEWVGVDRIFSRTRLCGKKDRGSIGGVDTVALGLTGASRQNKPLKCVTTADRPLTVTFGRYVEGSVRNYKC